MLRDITIGQYFPGHSFIHKMDPRMKLIAAVLYIIVAAAVLVIKRLSGGKKDEPYKRQFR